MKRTRTLHIGIASREYIHNRMLEIAKGERRQQPNEPKVWFTSFEALARVLSKQNRGGRACRITLVSR